MNNETDNNLVNRDYLVDLQNSVHNNRSTPLDEQFEVRLDPKEFLEKSSESSLQAMKKRWFVNLSGMTIPKNVQFLLQLGEKFSVPSGNSVEAMMEFFKNVESNMKKIRPHKFLRVRNLITSI